MTRKKRLNSKFIFRFALVYLFFVSFAFSAQEAVVTSKHAAIHEKPDVDSKVMESRVEGDRVHISSGNKNGWYKIKGAYDKFGWIHQSDIAVLSANPATKASDMELFKKSEDNPKERRDFFKPHFIFLKLGGAGFAVISRDINATAGASQNKYVLALGGFAELGFQLPIDYRISLRVMKYSGSTNFKIGDTEYEMAHTGFPILLGLDTDLYKGSSWSTAFGGYIGVSPSTTSTLTATAGSPPGNTFTVTETQAYSLFLNLSAKYWFSRNVSVPLEVGALYSHSQQHDVDTKFLGKKRLRASHLAPVLSLGLQFAI